MKKLMFASVFAASAAAFATPFNYTGFEGYEFSDAVGKTGVATRNDGAVTASPYYFCYQSASGSTDGSMVKAYGVGDNLPAFDYTGRFLPDMFANVADNKFYLELSTEGGTLWRSVSEASSQAEEGDVGSLGAALDLTQTDLYVDTMVQFTPTEDGTDPVVDARDQMAIWLNVDSTSNPDAPVTNLCVLAALVDELGGGVTQKFVINNVVVEPSKWYRLTVQTIPDITGDKIPGFKIFIDGIAVKTDLPTLTEGYITQYGEFFIAPLADVMNGSVFASLWTTEAAYQTGCCFPSQPKFQGVGFKGSGAIDDLTITPDQPNFFTSAGAIDFLLKWDANVSAVSYTLDDGQAIVPTEFVAGTAGQATIQGVAAGTVVAVDATAADWYKATVTGEGAITTADQTVEVKTELAATPEVAGANKLAGVKTEDAKAWATGKGISISAIEGCDFAKNAFLMNTDLTNEPGLAITSITEVEDGWQITVKGTQGENAVTLKGINGQLNIKAAATLEGLATAEATPVTLTDADFDEAGVATIKVTGDNKNFMKATVGVKATTAE